MVKIICRCVRAGRRSTIGNRVNGEHRFKGSNPFICAKGRKHRFSVLLFFRYNERLEDVVPNFKAKP